MRKALIVGVNILLAFSNTCNGIAAELSYPQEANQVLQVFVDNYNSCEYPAIYKTSGSLIIDAITYDNFVAHLDELHKAFGSVKEFEKIMIPIDVAEENLITLFTTADEVIKKNEIRGYLYRAEFDFVDGYIEINLSYTDDNAYLLEGFRFRAKASEFNR